MWAEAQKLLEAGDYKRAGILYRQLGGVDAMLGRGLCDLMTGDVSGGLGWLTKANKLKPDQPVILTALGTAYCAMGDYQTAERFHLRAIDLDPKFPDVFYNLGDLYCRTMSQYGVAPMGDARIKRAIDVSARYMHLQPRNFMAYHQAGEIRRLAGDPEAAEFYLNMGLKIAPGNPLLLWALGRALEAQGKFIAAENIFTDLIPKAEGSRAHDVRMARAQLRLRRGVWPAGWQDYKSRHYFENKSPPRVPLPEFDVALHHGRRVLIIDEQGLGDSIMHASYLRLFSDYCRAAGCAVDMMARARLLPLYKRTFGTDGTLGIVFGAEFVDRPDTWAGFKWGDYGAVAWIGSLGSYLGAPPVRSYGNAQYINHDWLSEIEVSMRMSVRGPYKKIGLSWRSGSAALGEYKSASLLDFKPMIDATDATFVNLQYGDLRAEIAAMNFGDKFFTDDKVDPLVDIDAHICMIKACHRIVTVSGTVAHLAGALGKPCDLILPHAASYASLWCWGDKTGPSPFYPTVTIHRPRTNTQEWRAETIAAVTHELNKGA